MYIQYELYNIYKRSWSPSLFVRLYIYYIISSTSVRKNKRLLIIMLHVTHVSIHHHRFISFHIQMRYDLVVVHVQEGIIFLGDAVERSLEEEYDIRMEVSCLRRYSSPNLRLWNLLQGGYRVPPPYNKPCLTFSTPTTLSLILPFHSPKLKVHYDNF